MYYWAFTTHKLVLIQYKCEVDSDKIYIVRPRPTTKKITQNSSKKNQSKGQTVLGR